uniref:SFRICE_033191 n=1 Tax=Spodoptera frugiperda TaxID=7108 RepID=A0A2H1VYN0_SPOFR
MRDEDRILNYFNVRENIKVKNFVGTVGALAGQLTAAQRVAGPIPARCNTLCDHKLLFRVWPTYSVGLRAAANVPRLHREDVAVAWQIRYVFVACL